RLMDAPKDLDQRALARPVLAGQRMNSPGAKAKIHGAQNLNRAEPFGDPAKFNYWMAKLHLGLVSFRFHTQVASLGSCGRWSHFGSDDGLHLTLRCLLAPFLDIGQKSYPLTFSAVN